LKQHIESLLNQAVEQLISREELPAATQANIQISHSKDAKLGDFACNLALMLAKPTKKNPRELAQLLVAALPNSDQIEKVEIAGPVLLISLSNKAAAYRLSKQY